MTLCDRLATVCDPEHPGGEHYRRPFRLIVRDQQWTVGLSEALLVAVRANCNAATVQFGKKKQMLSWLVPGPDDRNVCGPVLAKWAGSAEKANCDECHGTGMDSGIPCDWCDATGKVAMPMRPGRLREGVMINRYLLARGLAIVGSVPERVALGVVEGFVVRLVTPDWRILIARLADTIDESTVANEPAGLAE